MHNASVMHVLQPQCCLVQTLPRPRAIEIHVQETMEQLCFRDQFEHDNVDASNVASLEQLDHMRMAQLVPLRYSLSEFFG